MHFLRYFYSLVVLCLLWFPQVTYAQGGGLPQPSLPMFTSYGSFELMDGRNDEGQITYYAGLMPFILVQTEESQLRYSPHQVRTFVVDNAQFVTTGNFTIMLGGLMKRRMEVKRDFAELLEGGNLELLRHHYYTVFCTGPGPCQAYERDSYLLRKAGELAPFAVLDVSGKSDKKLRETLELCLSSRPDLLHKLQDQSINYDNLPACIHALNSGQPFTPVSSAAH
jgi:hypothetical protein